MKALKQAYLAIPLFDNDGEPLANLHVWVSEHLLHEFGGFTSWKMFGIGTLNNGRVKDDRGLVYCVAMEPSLKNAEKLREIARFVRRQAEQESVYIVLADGQVEFVEEGTQS